MIQNKSQPPEVLGEVLSIVFIGDFNPAIYQPSWFAAKGLMREAEAESAQVSMIHPEYAGFSTDWFKLEVTREKFTITTTSAAFKTRLRDLVISAFNILSQTPIRQMGINFDERLRFRSERDWHCFGHFLVPKTAWGKLLDKPGMRSVAIEGKRNDEIPGLIVILANPELGAPCEATLRANNHFENPNTNQNGTPYFLQLIGENYDRIMEESTDLLGKLIGNFVEQATFDDGSAT
ncbi:MAG: hypothetical protein NUV63_06565 [Gallionella sp.]|nr:hypothetical protein [Gallionella sp.]